MIVYHYHLDLSLALCFQDYISFLTKRNMLCHLVRLPGHQDGCTSVIIISFYLCKVGLLHNFAKLLCRMILFNCPKTKLDPDISPATNGAHWYHEKLDVPTICALVSGPIRKGRACIKGF